MKVGNFMMTSKEFIESQKECARMLGMSLGEYQEYCTNLKVPYDIKSKNDNNNYFSDLMKYFNIDKFMLKKEKNEVN